MVDVVGRLRVTVQDEGHYRNPLVVVVEMVYQDTAWSIGGGEVVSFRCVLVKRTVGGPYYVHLAEADKNLGFPLKHYWGLRILLSRALSERLGCSVHDIRGDVITFP